MFHLKPGVSLKGLQPQMVVALLLVEAVWPDVYGPTITSGSEGGHFGVPVAGGAADPHYEGLALDFRIHDLVDPVVRARTALTVTTALGPEFYVMREDLGGPNEHLHVQYGRPAK